MGASPVARVAGIDPGSHWIAVTVLARTVAGLVYVASLPIEVGHVEPLEKPRTVERADGTTYEIKQKRTIAPADWKKAIERLIEFLHEHNVEHVAVEDVKHFHDSEKVPPHVARARAAQLLRSQRIGGKIEGALLAGICPCVTEVDAVTSSGNEGWRKAAKRAAKVSAWKEAVRLLVARLPDALGEHEFDAAGLAAWIVRAPTVKREKRASGEGGPRKRVLTEEAKARHREVAREGWRAKAAEERARRIAAGCIGCQRKHVRACPLFVSKAERVAAAMG